MKKLTTKSKVVLMNLLVATHPDPKMREWLLNGDSDFKMQEEELLGAGLIIEFEGNLVPSKAGIEYFNNSGNTDVKDLIQQIRNVVPRNPSFQVMADNLTDTAVMGAIYVLFGQIGKRGEGEDAAYWQGKITDLQKALNKATPDILWDKHQKQQQNF